MSCPPAAHEHVIQAFFSFKLDVEPLVVKSSDTEGKPYGAPSALRRSNAGAPLLKGQKPDNV